MPSPNGPDNDDDDDLIDPTPSEQEPAEEESTEPAGEPEEEASPQAASAPQGELPFTPAVATRREDRIRGLIDENRRVADELVTTRRRLDELSARMSAPPQPVPETPEQRATRLSLMSPEDRLREEYREDYAKHTREMNMLAFNMADNSDRSTFQARAAVEPRMKKWEAKVENELADLRRNGRNATREQVLKYLVGDAEVARWSSPQQKKLEEEAGQRVQRQRVRVNDTRSDVAPQRSRRDDSAASREKRLENVPL